MNRARNHLIIFICLPDVADNSVTVVQVVQFLFFYNKPNLHYQRP